MASERDRVIANLRASAEEQVRRGAEHIGVIESQLGELRALVQTQHGASPLLLRSLEALATDRALSEALRRNWSRILELADSATDDPAQDEIPGD